MGTIDSIVLFKILKEIEFFNGIDFYVLKILSWSEAMGKLFSKIDSVRAVCKYPGKTK